jgi:predicted PurR-regulated permease PerM
MSDDINYGLYQLIKDNKLICKRVIIIGSIYILSLIIIMGSLYFYHSTVIKKLLNEIKQTTQQYTYIVDKLVNSNNEKHNSINMDKYKCKKYSNGIVCKRRKY